MIMNVICHYATTMIQYKMKSIVVALVAVAAVSLARDLRQYDALNRYGIERIKDQQGRINNIRDYIDQYSLDEPVITENYERYNERRTQYLKDKIFGRSQKNQMPEDIENEIQDQNTVDGSIQMEGTYGEFGPFGNDQMYGWRKEDQISKDGSNNQDDQNTVDGAFQTEGTYEEFGPFGSDQMYGWRKEDQISKDGNNNQDDQNNVDGSFQMEGTYGEFGPFGNDQMYGWRKEDQISKDGSNNQDDQNNVDGSLPTEEALENEFESSTNQMYQLGKDDQYKDDVIYYRSPNSQNNIDESFQSEDTRETRALESFTSDQIYQRGQDDQNPQNDQNDESTQMEEGFEALKKKIGQSTIDRIYRWRKVYKNLQDGKINIEEQIGQNDGRGQMEEGFGSLRKKFGLPSDQMYTWGKYQNLQDNIGEKNRQNIEEIFRAMKKINTSGMNAMFRWKDEINTVEKLFNQKNSSGLFKMKEFQEGLMKNMNRQNRFWKWDRSEKEDNEQKIAQNSFEEQNEPSIRDRMYRSNMPQIPGFHQLEKRSNRVKRQFFSASSTTTPSPTTTVITTTPQPTTTVIATTTLPITTVITTTAPPTTTYPPSTTVPTTTNPFFYASTTTTPSPTTVTTTPSPTTVTTTPSPTTVTTTPSPTTVTTTVSSTTTSIYTSTSSPDDTTTPYPFDWSGFVDQVMHNGSYIDGFYGGNGYYGYYGGDNYNGYYGGNNYNAYYGGNNNGYYGGTDSINYGDPLQLIMSLPQAIFNFASNTITNPFGTLATIMRVVNTFIETLIQMVVSFTGK